MILYLISNIDFRIPLHRLFGPPVFYIFGKLPTPLLFEPPRLLGTKEYGENSLYCASCYGYLRLRVQELS